MAYAFDVDETVPEAVQRITNEQVGRAISGLEHASGDDLEDAVHDCRKRAKKLRGLIRLVRPALGTAFRPANESFRAAGRELSGLRDAQAAVATFDTVVAASPDLLPEGGVRALSAPALLRSPRSASGPTTGSSGPSAPWTCSGRAAGRSPTPSSTPRGGRRWGPASRGPTEPVAGRWPTYAATPSRPRSTSGASEPRTPGTTSGCCVTPRPRSWSRSRTGSTTSPTPSATPMTWS